MLVGTIQKLIALFNEAFQELDVDVPLDKLERLAVRVHSAMTVQTRIFHTLEHVFNFVDPANPIRTLAALYHDIVYYQVDMGFSPEVYTIISPYIRRKDNNFYVADKIAPGDRVIWLTLDAFDLRPGQLLSSVDALNEFLSAVVMNKELEGIIVEKDLLRMTLCIEATIPFRGRNENGESHFEVLERRLHHIAEKYDIDLTTTEIETAVKMAVIFSNKDIENFSERDPARFLDNTWRLLPETNVALRAHSVYSIKAYRHALSRMEGFLNDLNPDDVFNRYRGAPPEEEYDHMVQCARRNIVTAREYLRIKLLASATLEALAEVTGGDAPMSLFMGDVPKEATSLKRIENYLPEVKPGPWVDRSSIIYRLLESGRASESGFDTKNSPLALFIYKSLEPDKLSHALDLAKGMFADTVTPEAFLAGVEPFIIVAISRASAQMVFTRREVLLKIAEDNEKRLS
jgi:hypothetical protein